ncbi:MAG: methyltransferase domain-containing protein [Elainellaceae cyanobacterium]
MAAQNDTLFERFLAPVFGSLLLDRDAMLRHRNAVDWEAECDRLQAANFSYPEYYLSQNFHGITKGYLTPDAAVTYDPITRYALPPNEDWVRQALVGKVAGTPRRILDLGCGTGSTALHLKRAFPNAAVVGLDLSPYMLLVAQQKAREACLEIEFRHGAAEATGCADQSFDLVTASLLFHETPPAVAQAILREGFRVLQPGGQALILDGCQSTLRDAAWLTTIFEEPYMEDYAKGSTDAWMGAAGFDAVRTDEFWWVHQVTSGVKPLAAGERDRVGQAAAQPVGDVLGNGLLDDGLLGDGQWAAV